MTMIGNQNAFVGLTIDLRTIGPVPVIVGQGILGLVGLSVRGPASVAEPLALPSDAKSLYYSGDLKDAIETAFSQGCPVVYAVRVLGEGYEVAEASMDDGLLLASGVGSTLAYSEGAWGNAVSVTVAQGSFDSTDVEVFAGDGSVGPYALEMCDLTTDTTTTGFPSSDYVKVNGIAKVLVNAESSLGTGKVYVDAANGTLKFFVGEEPTSTDLISVSLKYHTRRFVVTDNETTEVYNNVKSLTALAAAFDKSSLVRFEANIGATHLPAVGTYALTYGSDGDSITVNDWLNALELLGNSIAPTTVAITSSTSDPYDRTAVNDLVALLDGWAAWMANKFTPCQCFVAAEPGQAVASLLELASNFNNKWLTIVGNGWDNSTNPKNLAVARAAKEAAVSLGTSTAEAQNSLNGAYGLLYQFNQDETDTLTRGGIDVIIKSRGIRPYVGITTATDWQFMRCVDMRTVNWIIVALEYICKQYYFKRRTTQVMAAMQASIEAVLEEQKSLQNVEAYAVSVYPNSTDTNRVDIDLLLQNIGHIERVRTVMSVGIFDSGSSSAQTTTA